MAFVVGGGRIGFGGAVRDVDRKVKRICVRRWHWSDRSVVRASGGNGTEQETVASERGGWNLGVVKKGSVAVEEKAKGNGTPPPSEGRGGPVKAMGNTWTGLALGTAAQVLPFISKNQFVDAAYFFLVATAALFAGSKRNPTELAIDDLSSKQALLAPFTAGAFLIGCYLTLKYTSIDVSLIFQIITTAFGAACLKETLDPIFYSLYTKLNIQPNSRAVGEDDIEEDTEPWFSPKNLSSTAIAAAVTGAYALKMGPVFLFSNLIGFGTSVRCISILKPKSVVSAATLLTGLLLYDIFFVFGTDVMVSVATGIDAPAKFLFPHDAKTTVVDAAKTAIEYPYAILGLGDVVIPGVFTSLMVFVDKELVFGDEREVSHVPNGPYFSTAVVAYVLGLITCFVANTATQRAQPALLYLVPALLGSASLMALKRGELKQLLSFNRTSQQSIVSRDAEKKQLTATEKEKKSSDV